jgi:hypothetical protein
MVSFKVLHKIPTLLKKSLQIKWTQSIAVGNKSFLGQMKKLLGIRAKGRQIKKNGDAYQLREPSAAHGQWHELITDNTVFGIFPINDSNSKP